ncbi:MAG: YggS family pyridoxal phosphate-dependent enzyme [Promethearchaeota archaeon]
MEDKKLISNIGKNIKNLKIPEKIKLIAVSKKKSVEFIEEAYNSDHRDFGENYIQDSIPKIIKLKHLKDIRWHFIGHLQSNKVKLAAQYFDMIQSIDSKKLANKLNNACSEINKVMPILIEVNIAFEQSKGGIKKENLFDLLEHIKSLKNLKLCGLMCIPPYDENPEPYFKEMKFLFDIYKEDYNLDILSMGMSGDYSIAIAEGGNMVRVGTAIFGKRV